jgi:hypothetical protein
MARVTCEPWPNCEVEIIGSGRLSPGEAALLIANLQTARALGIEVPNARSSCLPTRSSSSRLCCTCSGLLLALSGGKHLRRYVRCLWKLT